MSPSAPRSSTLPSLGQLARLLHDGTAGRPGSMLLTVAPAESEVAIGTWPVPVEVDHPADPLVGFLAPAGWTALGLTTTGRAWSPEPEAGGSEAGGGTSEPTPVRITTLFGRDGAAASLIARDGQEPETIDDAPSGWVADVVARALGRPTAPPDLALSAWVEAAWLDRIAEVVLDAPGRVRRWSALARLHPLAPRGEALPAVLLAVETRALDLESSWSRLRRLWCADRPVATELAPPGGEPIALHDWFDDGSFSRWVTRDLVPAGELLPAVLDALPEALGNELRDALVGDPEG